MKPETAPCACYDEDAFKCEADNVAIVGDKDKDATRGTKTKMQGETKREREIQRQRDRGFKHNNKSNSSP